MAAVKGSLGASALGKSLMSLLDLRVSQINGCAFCVDMHARELRQHGESWQRLYSLLTWRETALYWPGPKRSRVCPKATPATTPPSRACANTSTSRRSWS